MSLSRLKRLLVLLVLVGCVAAGVVSHRRGIRVGGGVWVGTAWYGCPEHMRLVWRADDMARSYCIDAWEVHVEGVMGSPDQRAADSVPATGVAISAPGVIPSSATSFDMARALCANTPVLDRSGAVVGHKRLPSSQEWTDAADGWIGPGGYPWPYGTTYDDERCVTLKLDGRQPHASFEVTGSKPGCVSRFGVYDLSGNLWEWADPGLVVDIDRALALAEARGIHLRVDAEGYLQVSTPDAVTQLMANVVGVPDQRFHVDADGYLIVTAEQLGPRGALGPPLFRGYVLLRDPSLSAPDGWLPIEIHRVRPSPDAPARLRLLREHDGAPLSDKRGGAYYTGQAKANSTADRYLGHFHDFTGTIGFRCVGDAQVVGLAARKSGG